MSKTIKSYDKFAKELANKFDAIGIRRKDVQNAFSYVKKENPRVLELGCANGRDASEILKYTKNYIGIDGSKELIKIARVNLPQVKFIINTFDKLKFPNQNFDIVFNFASLMHLDKEELTKILKEIYYWLDDGGILFLSMKKGKYNKFISKGFGERIQYRYELTDIKNIIGSKFKIISVEEPSLQNQEWLDIFMRKNG